MSENSSKKRLRNYVLAFLFCIGLGAVFPLLFTGVVGNDNDLHDLVGLPRQPVGLEVGDPRLHSISLTDGSICYIGSRSTCVVTGDMSDKDFEKFIDLYGLADGLGGDAADLYLYKEVRDKMGGRSRFDLEEMISSGAELQTFEGKCRDAFFSGAYWSESKRIMFFIGY